MKRKILVSGLINIETTLKVESFPIHYSPVHYPFFGVHTSVSGVGYNVARALTRLGNEVVFLAMIGDDMGANFALTTLAADKIGDGFVYKGLKETPQSVIIYDRTGKRQIHVDLKAIQETQYPELMFRQALSGCTLACLCNINFSRAMLGPVKAAGIPIATDVHVLTDIQDHYNADFMRDADILFLSNEGCPGKEYEMASHLRAQYGSPVIVIGMGAMGALLSVAKNKYAGIVPAVRTREIVNTIGAGDALFSAFLHYYSDTHDPCLSLKKAMVFASWKIGEKGAAEGFLDAGQLEDLYRFGNIRY